MYFANEDQKIVCVIHTKITMICCKKEILYKIGVVLESEITNVMMYFCLRDTNTKNSLGWINH